MSEQNLNNHKQYYYPHHFVFYPVLLGLIIFSFCYSSSHPAKTFECYAFALILFLIGWLSFMMRQHYALGNQNRIIRLELRLRYFQLTQQKFDPFEQQLSFTQLAALRFASDEEFVALVQRSISENLSATDIKKSIRNWQPDYMRV